MRTKRRNKSARRIVPICIIGVVALVVIIGGSVAIGKRTPRTETLLTSQKKSPVSAVDSAIAVAELPPGIDEPTDASSQVNGKWYGLCAKNSVRSVEDIRRIIQSDTILSKYYSDFDWSRATAEKLHQPVSVLLAYRKDDVIRYSTRRIVLPKGEHYVTDGKRAIKSSCCNEFIDAAAPRPPDDPVIQSTPAAPPPLAYMPGTAPPKQHASPSIFQHRSGPPPVSPVIISSGGGGSPDNPGKRIKDPIKPVPVPEPMTFLLFGGGVAGICAVEMIRRRRKKE